MTGPSASELEIAIVGMACRFPGAASVEAFWQNLRNGVESVSFFSDEELREAGVGSETLRNPLYVKAAAVLSDVERFDARFLFAQPPKLRPLAQVVDPTGHRKTLMRIDNLAAAYGLDLPYRRDSRETGFPDVLGISSGAGNP